MKTIYAIALSFLFLSLTGCFSSDSSLVIYDKRSFAEIDDDFTINHQLERAIADEPGLKESRIIISVFNRIVFLAGQTQKASNRELATKLASKVRGVRRIYNEITIGDNLAYSTRAHDAWLTTQVKTMMLARKGLRSGSIKVVTENGVAYLLGRVTHEQANLAVDVARRVNGVKRVVKIFQYTD